MTSLVFILGDQLSPDISSLAAVEKDETVILMCEVAEEASYVKHHKKKLAFIFSAMRHFALELREAGWTVDYVKLDDNDNTGNFQQELDRAIARHMPDKVLLTHPSEYRVLEAFRDWQEASDTCLDILEDDRFICDIAEFRNWAQNRKQMRMEYFYREMRKKTDLLMDGPKPIGGKWNFDSQNRKPAKADLFMPSPYKVKPDAITLEVLSLVTDRFGDNFGDLEPFWFAVTREDAEHALTHFLREALTRFGDFQDAMLMGEKFLYHSLLSLYINIGLLDPINVCREVEKAYHNREIPLNAVEGFIRQIIGWREYVRGIYWLKMPEYVEQNFFDTDKALPDFYWTGETDMTCLREAITQTKEEAYAHHIQRLMITGNFALLLGVSPKEIHEWYLAVYVDAYEWVELPNTLGMSQFADGGMLGSKPYAASGNYIHKMSNYCSHCAYDVKAKTGANACPFNSLYWDFLVRNREKLEDNPRMTQMYRVWDKMDHTVQTDTINKAQYMKGRMTSST